MAETVLAAVTRFLVEAAPTLGLAREAVIRRAGLDERELSDPDARVPLRNHLAVWQALIEAGGDRDVGIALGRSFHLGAMGVVGHALGQAPTLAAALPFYRRCASLVSDLFMPSIVEDGGRVVFEQVSPPALVPLRHPAELGLAAALTLVRSLTDVRWPALGVKLQHPAPPSPAAVAAFFGARVEFGAPASRLELDAAVLHAPIRRSDPRLFEYLTRHADSVLFRVADGAPVADRARRAIAPALREGEPREAAVARRLGLSRRTLQRRLREEGTTFARIVDALRRELALLHLREPRLSAAEIAFLLGYAEPTAFFRAFRRWTGATPREIRSRLALAAPAGCAAGTRDLDPAERGRAPSVHPSSPAGARPWLARSE